MIIIIGGASCTGKTLLAQNLMQSIKIPYFCLDHLKMSIIRGNKDCPFKISDKDDKIAQLLSPYLDGLIRTIIENNQNLIIEGYYAMPHLIDKIEKEFPNKILPYYVGLSERYIKENFASIFKNRNCIEKRQYEEARTPQSIAEENKKYREECQKFEKTYFEVDVDYLKSFDSYAKQITKDYKATFKK